MGSVGEEWLGESARAALEVAFVTVSGLDLLPGPSPLIGPNRITDVGDVNEPTLRVPFRVALLRSELNDRPA